MLTYIVNNASGGIDFHGNTFHVTLDGQSTRTIQDASITAARLRLQYGATDEGVEHLMMHSKALTSTGSTRFHHLVEGRRSNSNIVCTMKKRLSNRKQYDEFELSTSHPLVLNHPLHQLDLFFTDSRGVAVPLGQGEEVTTTEFFLDEAITGLYKNQEIVTFDMDGNATAQFDGNLSYLWTETSPGVGTITGQVIDSTWEKDSTTNEITIYWDFANQGTSMWYKLEVGANKAQLEAISDWNNVYVAGTVVWIKDSGNFSNATNETFVDGGEGSGTVDGNLWEFDPKTGHITVHENGFKSTFSAINGSSDKIRLLLKYTSDPRYSSTPVDTQVYRENTSTGTGDPVSEVTETGPSNGFTGEEVLLHVELNCRHKST